MSGLGAIEGEDIISSLHFGGDTRVYVVTVRYRHGIVGGWYSAWRISVSEYEGNNAGCKEIICGVDTEEKSFRKWMELRVDLNGKNTSHLPYNILLHLHVVGVRYHRFLEVWNQWQGRCGWLVTHLYPFEVAVSRDVLVNLFHPLGDENNGLVEWWHGAGYNPEWLLNPPSPQSTLGGIPPSREMGTFPPTEVQYLYSSLLSHVTPTGCSRKFYLFLFVL